MVKVILNSILIVFITAVGVVTGEDVDFGTCDLNPGYSVDCPITLNVDCENENSNTGTISSPYYPNPMQDNDLWGKVYNLTF